MSQGAISHSVLGTEVFAVVTTTVTTSDGASALARALVSGQFAACVQIVNVGSVYNWKGIVEEHPEWMLICKIRAADYGDVEAAILALHEYETPEIIAVPILDGFQPYLDWIAASTVRQDEE
ncbi:MAG: divalent-cation tolerance protein CutA [Beijerinckiaceae bacterium]|nr:divalent-cation tolerance protein CutA [Beijerinckiaceae bacterium]